MIGLFGGTFNPIHVGHIRSAIDVGEILGLDQVRLMPANVPPHKNKPGVNSEHRAAMVKLAITDIKGLEFENIELQREEPSYTYETLKILSAKIDQPLVLVLGVDAFSGLPSWYRWEGILELAHIAVLKRPGSRMSVRSFPPQWVNERLTKKLHGSGGGIVKIASSRTEISSTTIRKKIREGRSIRYLVPETVETYIFENKLYS